jgi:hypothetical protein
VAAALTYMRAIVWHSDARATQTAHAICTSTKGVQLGNVIPDIG